MEQRKFFTAKRITGLAVLLALVIVLQVFGSYFKIGATSFSFVLVPIVLAGLLYGPIEGGIVGFAFGVVVIIQGATGVDGFTLILLQDHPVWTILLCLVKGTMAGAVSGVLFKTLEKKNGYVAVFLAAAAAPIVNTGLFIGGALCFLQDTLKANFVGGQTVIYFLVVVCAGVNFLVEFAINLVLAPALCRVVQILGKNFNKEQKPRPTAKNLSENEKPALDSETREDAGNVADVPVLDDTSNDNEMDHEDNKEV